MRISDGGMALALEEGRLVFAGLGWRTGEAEGAARDFCGARRAPFQAGRGAFGDDVF